MKSSPVGPSDRRLGPVAAAGIAAIAAFRVVPGVAEMIVQIASQGAIGHHLDWPAQKPALAGQPQPAGAGPFDKLLQLLIGRRQLRCVVAPSSVTSVTGVSLISGVTPLNYCLAPRSVLRVT